MLMKYFPGEVILILFGHELMRLEIPIGYWGFHLVIIGRHLRITPRNVS